eukprot:scaffold792_cov60-Phaeocystis_antarctica.AAC.4
MAAWMANGRVRVQVCGCWHGEWLTQPSREAARLAGSRGRGVATHRAGWAVTAQGGGGRVCRQREALGSVASAAVLRGTWRHLGWRRRPSTRCRTRGAECPNKPNADSLTPRGESGRERKREGEGERKERERGRGTHRERAERGNCIQARWPLVTLRAHSPTPRSELPCRGVRGCEATRLLSAATERGHNLLEEGEFSGQSRSAGAPKTLECVHRVIEFRVSDRAAELPCRSLAARRPLTLV